MVKSGIGVALTVLVNSAQNARIVNQTLSGATITELDAMATGNAGGG